MEEFHLHLVSDATGETVQTVARACLVQFEGAQPTQHIWTLVRNDRQVEEVIRGVKKNPGFVLFTLVNVEIRNKLQTACHKKIWDNRIVRVFCLCNRDIFRGSTTTETGRAGYL